MGSYSTCVEGYPVTVEVWEVRSERKYSASVQCPVVPCKKKAAFVAFRKPSAKKAREATITELKAHMRHAHKK